MSYRIALGAAAALVLGLPAMPVLAQTPAAPSSPELVALPPAPPRPGGLMNPELGLVLDTALAGYSDPAPLPGGAHDPQGPGFSLQLLELTAGAAVDPYWRFDSALLFSAHGAEIEEAYGTTTALPFNLQARAGQFLTRFGRFNATHPHAWDFVDQPLVFTKFFGGEGNRGPGAELSWLMPWPWYAEWVIAGNQVAGEEPADGSEPPAGVQLTGALKQFWPLGEDWSVAWGLSAAQGGPVAGTELYGSDLYLKYRPVEAGRGSLALHAEVLARRRAGLAGDMGGLVGLTWRLDPSWSLGARYELVGGVANDPAAPEWTGDRQRATAQVTWWASEFSRLRLQGSADMPSWRSGPVYAVFLTSELVVGAHGAHAF